MTVLLTIKTLIQLTGQNYVFMTIYLKIPGVRKVKLHLYTHLHKKY